MDACELWKDFVVNQYRFYNIRRCCRKLWVHLPRKWVHSWPG
jgi:hypothetical protein